MNDAKTLTGAQANIAPFLDRRDLFCLAVTQRL
jgi:hypothetical protein